MKTKNTLRALYASIASLIVCMSMLVGSTFAWFTDVANTNVNEIQAGELDVALEMYGDSGWENAEGKTLPFKTADNRAQEKIRWEPGCTYELPALKIVNHGDLAFKYNMYVTGIEGDLELAEVLEVIVNGQKLLKSDGRTPVTLSDLTVDADGAAYGILLPKGEAVDEKAPDADKAVTEIGETQGYTIALHMSESAGNKYQKMRLRNMSFTVYAYQYTYEYDSYNNQYDAMGSIEDGVAINADELFQTLQSAMDKGGRTLLIKDLKFSAYSEKSSDYVDWNYINGKVDLDMQGHTIKLDPVAQMGVDPWVSCFLVTTAGDLTIRNGNINMDVGENSSASIYIAGGKAKIVSGTYTGMHAVYVGSGSLEISGGFFDLTDSCKEAGLSAYADQILINCLDKNYKNGTAKVSITGGTFVNFNPANNKAEGAGTNFVAEGYKVVSETQENGEIWYTVVPE